jgi:hypothetical protein
MSKGIAICLLILSLFLLIIYGADAAVASSSSDGRGFLPLDEALRGGVFGGGAVVMSIAGFVIGRKEHAPMISVLLFVNGLLIVVGMLALIARGVLASEDSLAAIRTIGSTIAMGIFLIALGAWKVAIDRKTIAAKGKEPAQK